MGVKMAAVQPTYIILAVMGIGAFFYLKKQGIQAAKALGGAFSY